MAVAAAERKAAGGGREAEGRKSGERERERGKVGVCEIEGERQRGERRARLFIATKSSLFFWLWFDL